MNSDILFFVKFGERVHLESLLKGEMYFSNAGRFREIEEEQLKKGQGDKYDGMFNVLANKAVLTSHSLPQTSYELFNKIFNIDFGENSMKATFCITAGTRESCSWFQDERHYKIQFSNIQANVIREHFTKADSVLLIKNPLTFMANVFENIGYACYGNKVLYYKKDHLTTEFIDFIFGDNFEVYSTTSNIRQGHIDDRNVHRLLLCKDIFFTLQQEFRFVLYKTKINNPQNFAVSPIVDGEIYTLDEFFAGIEVNV